MPEQRDFRKRKMKEQTNELTVGEKEEGREGRRETSLEKVE